MVIYFLYNSVYVLILRIALIYEPSLKIISLAVVTKFFAVDKIMMCIINENLKDILFI